MSERALADEPWVSSEDVELLEANQITTLGTLLMLPPKSFERSVHEYIPHDV